MGENTKAGKTAKKAPTFKALPDDIIIPVMGPIGVGKSTFINHLAGDTVNVGHDLKSCTAELQPVVMTSLQYPKLQGQRLVIVDTPGFDSTTYLSDLEIWRLIELWLATAYRSEMKLGGVIYFHDISLSRMLSTPCKLNPEEFQKLCGDDPVRSVVLGTTKWGNVAKDVGDMRTQQLCDYYWRDMLNQGSKVLKFEDSSKSAWTIVDSIVELHRSRAKDTHFTDAKEGDIIVPVMGPSGVGKSSFINSYLGQEKAQVGHDLQSCTTTLQPFIIDLPPDSGNPRRLVLVDTPGFDDTNEADSEILRRIAVWLASCYGPGKTCGGLIYLHDVTEPRMRGATLQNLKVFRRLCGKKNLKAVVFGTTKSSKLTPEAFAMREKELTDVYWKDFKKQGAIVFNLLPSHDSAHQLVQTVLDRVQERRVLRIQKELVDLAKTLPATDAGKELKHTLEEIMKHQKRALAGDNLTDEQIAAHKRKIATIAPQIKQLTMKHSFSQRLSKFFGLGG